VKGGAGSERVQRSQVAARRPGLTSPVVATVLGGLVVALATADIVLAGLVHRLTALSVGPQIAVILIYAGVGVIVARRQPGNPIGWILLIFILLFQFSSAAGDYAVFYYRFGHHGLPLAPVAVLLLPMWAPALLLFPLVVLLFPDGRLASRRWRWLLWAYAAAGACASAAIFAPAVTAVAGHDIHLDAFGDVTNTASQAARGAVAAAQVLGLALMGVIWLSFVAHQVLNWRRATGERRQQLKWLASGASITVVLVIASFTVNSTGVAGEILGIGLAALPVSIGVGILKYRLYEIDRIISRTLAYAIVTGLLAGVYTGLVLLATQAPPVALSTPVAVAVATLAAAALFNPLRHRVQRIVDRRFNRARYDADKAIGVFAARLTEAVDLDSVRDDLAAVVRQALEPVHVSVWISRAG
jgi:hypothetical protein